MTNEDKGRRRAHSLIDAIRKAVSAWRAEQRLRRSLLEIARRGDDHLLDDIGLNRDSLCARQTHLPARERVRDHFWML